MNDLLVIFVFLVATAVSLLGGVTSGFALVYLPVVLLLDMVPPLQMQGAWDLTPSYAAIVGVTVALLFERPENRVFRVNVLDVIVALLAVTAIASGVSNEQFYTGVNLTGLQLMGWILPYYFARLTFRSPDGRRKMLWALVGSAVVVGLFALLEMRFVPFLYRIILRSVGLVDFGPRMAYYRFGLFRAESTMDHPIYLGNACLSVLGLIYMLAHATGVTLRNQYVWAGLAAAGAGLLGCLSFSPYNGLLFAAVVYVLLTNWGWARRLLVPMMLAGVAVGFLLTASIALSPLGEKPIEGHFMGSWWTRQLIIKNSWDMVSTAGPLGHGRIIPKWKINLDSVDNTYMLFGMTRGWIYLALWLGLGVALAMRVSKAYRACVSRTQVTILSAGMASVVGIMIAMYTVWAGWQGYPYTMLWLVCIAATNSAAELILAQNVQVVQPTPESMRLLADRRSAWSAA